MKVVKMFKKGVEQLQRKKKIRDLKAQSTLKRDELSELYLEIGLKISDVDIEKFADFEEVNSMHNILNIIDKLEHENLELEEKIDITKEDYNHQIEEYTPLIAELKENLSIPQNKLLNLKENLIDLKKVLKGSKDTLKEKEGIFKDTQDRLDNKSEEDNLDEEKILILENDYKRLQKELLEITHDFEEKTDKYNSLKESIKITEEEIKTADDQINTYKKEIGRLKKEKVREIDAIKKTISSNNNSLISRGKELDGIYKNIGNLSFKNNVLPENFQPLYEKVSLINFDIEKINKERQNIMIEAEKQEGYVLFKFFSIIIAFIAILIFISWGIYKISSPNSNKKAGVVDKRNSVTINNLSCNKGEISVKIPKDQKPPFSVKSKNLFSNINQDGDILKIVFSSDQENEADEYTLHVFSSGKEFNKYIITSKKDNDCLNFFLSKNE
jgi:hypothetical protein